VIEYRESRINAHHNYLVNNMLTPGFSVGDPNSAEGFFFVADCMLPGESTPRISARLMKEQGGFLLELIWNRISRNPDGCVRQPISGGFRLLDASSKTLLEIQTETFARGYLTRITARLYDENRVLRMEPFGESVQVHGDANLVLDTPLTFPSP
jgi:hypothetical protein